MILLDDSEEIFDFRTSVFVDSGDSDDLIPVYLGCLLDSARSASGHQKVLVVFFDLHSG